MADTVDPLGGSYAVESLTDRIEQEAEKLIEKIEELGGQVRCIEEGFMQKAIADSAYEYQKGIETNDHVIVGLNQFQVDEKLDYSIIRVSPEVERECVERIRAVRKRRDAKRAAATLAAVEKCARGTDNLFPPILEAVKAECTTGEISDALRNVFGVYQEC